MNQEQLIKGCIKHNAKAQEELYRRYKDALYILCLKYCRNEAEAEDILHNTFIEIYMGIKNFKNKGSFEGWMKRIAINKAVDSYKKTAQLVPIKQDFNGDTEVTDSEMNLPLDYLLSVVQQLPDQYRLVFSLYELDDYSHREIAEMLSITESTSKSNLHRAKMILKNKIKAKHTYPNLNVSNGK